MSKNNLYKLLALSMSLGAFNDNYFYEFALNKKVSDCLSDLYFSILSKEDEITDKYYNLFEEKYNNLNDEDKEIVKIEIAKIFDIEYEPKVKKKEKRRDE